MVRLEHVLCSKHSAAAIGMSALCQKQTYLKDATCPVISELHEGDVVCHCQQAHICIRTRRSCIGRVASEARHYQDTRSHAACVPLRRHHVLERYERDAASLACAHSETLGVSGLFASESCASAPLASGTNYQFTTADAAQT